MKVVINKCFGGFSLSNAAILRYAQIKGLTLFPEAGEYGFTIYYLQPKENRVAEIDWATSTMDQRRAYNEASANETLYDSDIERNDPALAQVVEEMGNAANGKFAELAVVEIPDGTNYEISDYDGSEHIAETHRTWG